MIEVRTNGLLIWLRKKSIKIEKYLNRLTKVMNKILLVLGLVIVLGNYPVFAKKQSSGGGSHSVKGHFKKDGTYVQPHRATNPNHTQRDNWSSKPNVNPNTGKPGTKEVEK